MARVGTQARFGHCPSKGGGGLLVENEGNRVSNVDPYEYCTSSVWCGCSCVRPTRHSCLLGEGSNRLSGCRRMPCVLRLLLDHGRTQPFLNVVQRQIGDGQSQSIGQHRAACAWPSRAAINQLMPQLCCVVSLAVDSRSHSSPISNSQVRHRDGPKSKRTRPFLVGLSCAALCRGRKQRRSPSKKEKKTLPQPAVAGGLQHSL